MNQKLELAERGVLVALERLPVPEGRNPHSFSTHLVTFARREKA